MSLPAICLSIRQPWAWLILHGGKDVENRRWKTNFRGPVLIHAAKGMTRREYEDARDFSRLANRRVVLPDFGVLERGGIVGCVQIVDCVQDHESPSTWSEGPFCFVLRNPKPLPFTLCRGALGFFNLPPGVTINASIGEEGPK